MFLTTAIIAGIAAGVTSAPVPVCEYEDGSEMLYSQKYDTCSWNGAESPVGGSVVSYFVKVDRSTETDQGAKLTYVYVDTFHHVTTIEPEWVQK